MVTMNLVKTYAPTLLHLHEQLQPFGYLILSQTAGPQPQSKEPKWWSSTEPYILIQVVDPYNQPGESCYVCIFSEEECIVSDDGDYSYITFQDLLYYFAQLPRPLYTYDRT